MFSFKRKLVVSANYNDRQSLFKWLMRKENESPKKAIAFKTVTATGVEFRGSNAWEFGFGCSIIALCKTAKGSNESSDNYDKTGFEEITFKGVWFETLAGNVIEKVDELFLDENGKVWAKITAKEPELVMN